MSKTSFLLASTSPQRKTILTSLGVEFIIVPNNFDESSITEKDPMARARILAAKKAESVAQNHPDQWVIGVDTLVVSQDGQLLEKPVDANDARRMLRLHSGRTSAVHSGICVCRATPLDSGALFSSERISERSEEMNELRVSAPSLEKSVDLSTAYVTFKKLSDADIDWWIDTGLWKDRSGAFQIEGDGQKLITKLEGEYETVVGFPVKNFQNIAALL